MQLGSLTFGHEIEWGVGMSDTSYTQLRCGRRIHLKKLYQYCIGGGLLDGLPTVEMCREEVERAVRIAKQWLGTHGEPFLIAPTECLVQLGPEKQWGLKFGQPVAIPAIAC